MKATHNYPNLTTPRRGRQTWLALGLIVLLAAIGYGFLWEPGKTPYSAHSDFISEHVSTKQVLYDSIRQGHGIPFWRSDQFSGYAGLISPQSQFTYPLHFLFCLLPPLSAAGPTFWLHFLGAGLAFYAVGASLGLGLASRVTMAAAGMFGFKLIIATYAGWLPNIPILIWFPALFAAVFQLVRRPGLGASLLVALAGAMCLHCGHLQLFYYSAWFLLVYVAIALAGLARAKQWAAGGRTAGWLALGGVLAVGGAAYLLIPLAAEASLVSRSQTVYEFFLGNHAIQPRHFLTFLYPEALGSPLDHTYKGEELWEDAAYFGLVPLALAGAGAVLGWRRKPTRYLLGGLAVSLLLSMDTPVLRLLFDFLPGFRLFRIPARFLFLAAFFGLALAGIGMEELIDRLRRRPGRRSLATILTVVAVSLIAVEGAYYARRYLTMAGHEQAVPDTGYRRFLAADKDLYRVATVARQTVSYGWAAPMGMQLINGNDSFNYRPYQLYFELLHWGEIRRTIARAWYDLVNVSQAQGAYRLNVRGDLMDALNVKYLLAPVPLEFPDGHFEQAAVFRNQPLFVLYSGAQRGDLWLYRNRQFLPRAFWAGQLVPAGGAEDQIVEAVRRSDLRRQTVVCPNGGTLPPSTASPEDRATVEAFAPGRLTISTANAQERLLVVSEIWHGGWRATIDGDPVPVYRANLAMLGLAVPAGEHRIELVFQPLRWRLSLGISLATAGAFLAMTCAWVVARRVVARRQAPSNRR